jgi:hypothetical protein
VGVGPPDVGLLLGWATGADAGAGVVSVLATGGGVVCGAGPVTGLGGGKLTVVGCGLLDPQPTVTKRLTAPNDKVSVFQNGLFI